VRVPAGEFDAYRVIYRIEKSRHVEQYEIWVSTDSPHFMVREAFPNGAVTELTQVMPSVQNTARSSAVHTDMTKGLRKLDQ
jgi:hypothetical protein